MNKQTNIQSVPKLRFPEFKDTGAWVEKKLGKVLCFETGFPFDSSGFNEVGDGVRLIRNRDLKSDEKIIYYNKSYEDKFLVENGDILIGMDGDFSPCVWVKGKALLNQRVGRIKTKIKGEERFFFYVLSIRLKEIEKTTARTTVKHLSHSDVEKIQELLPQNPTEQQKIAECLCSIDKPIEAQGKKLETLKEHKKGLMQQLFPNVNGNDNE